MNRPLPAGLPASQLSSQTSSLAEVGQFARPDRRPQRSKPLMRKYEVAYLASNGDGMTAARIAPATVTFETAFMAFARGTLIQTSDGYVAVEDLFPGMDIMTADQGPQPLMWMGATTIVPGAPGQTEAATRLTRIATETFGPGRPTQDLMLGYGARLFRATHRDHPMGHFKKASELIDGMSAVDIYPPSPVRVFHLALKGHARLIANGVEVESFHPGALNGLRARSDLEALYLSLFPHVRSIEEFGPMAYPRDVDDLKGTDPLVLY
ncbi:Hint domain-containing protein [Shimia ponticola]|uniref:Hint domain-containing protein n=1 Tax=Shimia ponticola TaxID=2582893 RepID=UPI0011BDED60|nr:Hint domain-containing protein [Shimia ponticola]